MTVKLRDVRLAFPALFVPESYKDGPLKYKATLLVPKTSDNIKLIEDAILEAAKAHPKFGAKAAAIVASLKGNANKFCYQDGDLKGLDGYDGCMVVTASSKKRPLVLGMDKSPLTVADGILTEGGDYVHANVDFFAYDNTGKGISCGLEGIMMAKPGDSFSAGKVSDTSDFDDLADGADAADFA